VPCKEIPALKDSSGHNSVIPWVNDAFSRKDLADYLSQSIGAHADISNSGAAVAVDADWGAGKTFFVCNWIEDLKAAGHPVVYFDAWMNDSNDEPAVALMASILEGLEFWQEKLPKGEKFAGQAKSFAQEAVKSLRSALLPAAGVVAKGLLKRATGIAADEVRDALMAGDAETVDLGSEAIVGDALDHFFEKALSEHRKRRESLDNFRAKLQQVLAILKDHANAKFPFFVFIDELDRCRPSYAIKLLEEVKHIFGISGVVYVVSTNIDQLQNSVRAEYGAEFDGRRYLRKMFAKEYILPAPEQSGMAKLALSRLDFTKGGAGFVVGLPSGGAAADAWGVVAKAVFPIDLRAQLQALDLLREVFCVLSQKGRVHFIWLAYLAALYVHDKKALSEIADGKVGPHSEREFVVKTISGESSISYRDPSSRFISGKEVININFVDIVATYLKMSTWDVKKIDDFAYSDHPKKYPESLAREVAHDLQKLIEAGVHQVNPLRNYASTVLLAGRITS
jgi:hypothetical protein